MSGEARGTGRDWVPSLAVGGVGVLWGLYWIPMRLVHEAGVEGAWASFGTSVVAIAALLPVIGLRWRRLLGIRPRVIVTGFLAGASFAAYGTALLLTEVVRAALLYYLTPVWGTLLALVLLGQPISRRRLLTLVLGLGGLYVILQVDGGFPWPRNMGDWLGLASGVLWAYASLCIFANDAGAAVHETVIVFVAATALVLLPVLALPVGWIGPAPGVDAVRQAAPWLLLTALGFMLPMMIVMLWGATRLDPGRLGLLTMIDVPIGVGSAALLAGEPFGMRELVGAVLVTGAAVIEVLDKVAQPPKRLVGRRRPADRSRPRQ